VGETGAVAQPLNDKAKAKDKMWRLHHGWFA
jgi:hypothetical protein